MPEIIHLVNMNNDNLIACGTDFTGLKFTSKLEDITCDKCKKTKYFLKIKDMSWRGR